MSQVKRSSGVLLHISSLPSQYGIGDLGEGAYQFVDFLEASSQRYWQILPLNPTDHALGDSPYSSNSAFAMNTLFISLDGVIEEGFLIENDLQPIPEFSDDKSDYFTAGIYKNILFDRAFNRFKKKEESQKPFARFCEDNKYWLEDFALFMVLKEKFSGQVWSSWPQELRERKPGALNEIRQSSADPLERIKFLQFILLKQWTALKLYCQKKNVCLIGDIPIYVTYDSADVWAHPDFFKLDQNKKPITVAGVPPDYFSQTGQRWGNPIYVWESLKETNFQWWIERLRQNFKAFDIVRIDHFRGLISYWEIPEAQPTAVNGQWSPVPYNDLFKRICQEFPNTAIIAEDLGIITPDVPGAMNRFGFAGMKILLFAFGGDYRTNPYIPENHIENCVVYTGTHDNNTVRGWFENDISQEEKKNLFEYMRRSVSAEEVSWLFIALAMTSRADRIIIPLQDILGLGPEGRMNTPGTSKNNWQWRFIGKSLTPQVTKKLQIVTQLSQRT